MELLGEWRQGKRRVKRKFRDVNMTYNPPNRN